MATPRTPRTPRTPGSSQEAAVPASPRQPSSSAQPAQPRTPSSSSSSVTRTPRTPRSSGVTPTRSVEKPVPSSRPVSQPVTSKPPTKVPDSKPVSYKPKSGSYTVGQGETLSSIARKHNLGVDDLIDANLNIHNPNLIYPGQKINLPSGSYVKPTPTSFDKEISLASSRQPLKPMPTGYEKTLNAKGTIDVLGPEKPLAKYGDRGPQVEAMQNFLKAQGYNIGKTGADGIWGPDTQKAFVAYQKNEGAIPWSDLKPKTSAPQASSPYLAASYPSGKMPPIQGKAHIGGTPLTNWNGVPVGTPVYQTLAGWKGKPVKLTDGYRSAQQQATLAAQKPGLAAPVGSSFHERGLAIDVDYSGWSQSEIDSFVKYMKSQGYTWGGDFRTKNEPWHFGYHE